MVARYLDEMSPRDRFLYDPSDPVPTTDGAKFHFLEDILRLLDQREVESRSDVLVYTAAPARHALEVLGPVSAESWASTEGRSMDVTASWSSWPRTAWIAS